MTTLLLATRNLHKAQEIQAILGGAFHCRTLKDFPQAPEVREDADTFTGNATKKAETLARWLDTVPDAASWLVLADDSGLEVDALNGAPGVISARFAALNSGGKANTPDSANNAKLLRLLREVPAAQRTARFRCVLALTRRLDGGKLQTELFEGTCEGRIATERHGHGGFGYDPLFIPEGHTESFAQLGEVEKNRISHRASALARLNEHFRHQRNSANG